MTVSREGTWEGGGAEVPTGPLGVDGSIGDPILLRKGRGRVDDELVCGGVEGGGRLHLHCVVAWQQRGERGA